MERNNAWQSLEPVFLHSNLNLRCRPTSDHNRKPNEKSCPFPRFRFGPDLATMMLSDFAAVGQSEPSSRKPPPVEPLADPKNPLQVLRLNADAVVAKPKEPLIVFVARTNVKHRRSVAVKLKGIF